MGSQVQTNERLPKLLVSFACNHPENGAPAGVCGHVQIDDPLYDRGENLLSLEGGEYDDNYEICGPEFNATNEGVVIAGELFKCEHFKSWYGNWCWELFKMSAKEAARMAVFLRGKGWGCERGIEPYFTLYKYGAPESVFESGFRKLAEAVERIQRKAVT